MFNATEERVLVEEIVTVAIVALSTSVDAGVALSAVTVLTVCASVEVANVIVHSAETARATWRGMQRNTLFNVRFIRFLPEVIKNGRE